MTEGSKAAADSGLLDGLTAIASRAAAAIVAIALPALAQRSKADDSPVTIADEASQDVIFEGLCRLLPGVPVVSEEAVTAVAPGALGRQFILVDPLDGTRELLAGRARRPLSVNQRLALHRVIAKAEFLARRH